MDWENIKARIPVVIILDSGRPASQNITTNQASADIKGVEFEGSAALADNLSMQAAINWSNAEFTEFNCAGFVRQFTTDLDCAGNRTIRFPEWSGSVAATWSAALTSAWDYCIRGDARYVGERFADVANSAVLEDYRRVNLRVGFVRDDVTLEGYVTNPFRRRPLRGGSALVRLQSAQFRVHRQPGRRADPAAQEDDRPQDELQLLMIQSGPAPESRDSGRARCCLETASARG